MRKTTLALLATAAIALIVSAAPGRAQSALTGTVTSAEEGAMEGVLVTAKRDGWTVAITVVTDAQGHYGFPAARLEPGHYTLRIRAVGYDLDGKPTADVVAGGAATADLRLKKARNVASQLTNAEWIESVPGTPVQKDALFNCVGCHTLERIVKSTHDADEFVQTMKRMNGYANQSLPVRPQKRKAERLLEERGDEREALFRKRAEWLASINLSEGQTWEYPLKTLPRPTGR
jgi:virginiamycin B lyase